MAKEKALSKLSVKKEEKGREKIKLSLLDQPPEIIKHITSFIGDYKSKAALARTCKTINNFFQHDLDKIKLLQHVVRGELAQAEEMVKRNPVLLLKCGEVTDYSGRTIRGKAFPIALGCEDLTTIADDKKSEEMAEMLRRYLLALPNGELEMAKQLKEQFPDGWYEKEKEREKKDSEAINKLFIAISEALTDLNRETALSEFRSYLKPKETLTTGIYFNSKLLVEALKLFERNFLFFGGSGSAQNIFVACKVIGYIERFLPTCYAQAICQGLGSKDKPLVRTLRVRKGRSEDFLQYYPIDLKSTTGLGFDFLIYYTDEACTHREGTTFFWDELDLLQRKKRSRLATILEKPGYPHQKMDVV